MSDPLAPPEGQWSWFSIWARSIRAAYKLAYGERAASLKGKTVKRFDDRGLHPYSEQWGRITLSESLLFGELGWALPDYSPHSLRVMAYADAYHDFINELREETDDVAPAAGSE